MASALFALATDGATARASWRRTASKLLRGGMEVALLIMVCLSPWAFGSVGPDYESLLYGGVAVLLLAWGVRMLPERDLSWQKCPVALCLAALMLYAVWQRIPLPRDWLSRLSPATARLYGALLPAQEEVLPFGEAREAPVYPAGSTLSLYPACTREELIRLLAVFGLFAVVRNNFASSGSLRRLSILALVNGACLSLFALILFFTSSGNTLYWTWPNAGTIFGPFVNRNHFAIYLNLCIGLSFGLLLRSKYFASDQAQENPDRVATSLLEDWAALWTIAGLVLMVSSVVFCGSRGGIVALLCGWIGFLLFNLLHSSRFRRIGAILLVLSLALALAGWFGLGPVQARLATLWGKEVFQESRLEVWSRVLPLVKEFPVWGTGYGTFQFMEPLYRTDPLDEKLYTNVENDYLEALIEGGLVRLALSLLAIGLVFALGYRAVRRGGQVSNLPPHERYSGLAMGAFFGFITLVVQSFVDFGIHIPAIALLATVVSAHLCAAGTFGASDKYSLRLWGLAPIAGAALAGICGLFLASEGWRTYRIDEFRQAAALPGSAPAPFTARATPEDRAQQIECLAAAARLAPESARLQIELALAHYDAYRDQLLKLQIRSLLSDVTQAVGEAVPARCSLMVLPLAGTVSPAWASLSGAGVELSKDDEKPLVRQHLVPTLRHVLQARDLCPLLPEPQRLILENRDQLEQADALSIYLERARRLVPYDPGLWYTTGLELLDKQPDQAWRAWRRCLELSDLYFTLILQQSAARLDPRELCDRVLPEDPHIWLAAALQLYPQSAAKQQLLLDHALALFEQRPALNRPEGLHMKAVIQSTLGRTEEAIASYQAALDQEPRQVSWRFELAKLLYERRRVQEARWELLTVLAQQPENSDAQELLTLVDRQIAETP